MTQPELSKKPIEKDAERVNNIMLGPLERPALAWMAKKMPEWVTPDTLTAIGFFATVLIFVSYILTNQNPAFLWLASFGFLLNWFGDSLDGTLARLRHIERPRYGFFVDHTVDALSEVLIFLGIGLSPYVRFDFACLALIGYLLFSILVYIMTYVKGVFRISYLKLGPTEMRVIAIIANAVVFFSGNPQISLPFGTFTLYDMLAGFIAILLTCGFVVVMLMQASELSKQDVANREKKVKKAKQKKIEQTSTQVSNNL
jgi:phosphatidylglycerophosphate synthase